MKLVKQLIYELGKYSDNSMCYAYEGEVTGLIIIDEQGNQSVIHCSESELDECESIHSTIDGEK